MPELPEVEYGRKLLERVAVGRTITRAKCSPDAIVFDGTTAKKVEGALRRRRVVAASRHGKHLWLELDQRPWPMFHFGMTGAFRVPDQSPLPIESDTSRRDAGQWPPRFVKIQLFLDDGGEIAMTNARRLGRIRLRDDPKGSSPIVDLGFDPLLELPRLPAFRVLVSRRRAKLKGLLLDQSFAAGVGNWIADEVLYHARLDPRRLVDSLGPEEVKRLHASLRKVVQQAVAVDARKEKFPRTWLFHRRWGKNPAATTHDGHPIRHETIAGRTTAWVPELQH